MSSKVIDSHCHLNYPQFEGKLEEIISRAKDEGVEKMLTISTKLNEINDLKSISNLYSQVFYSVGVHPHECKNYKNLLIDDLLKHANKKKCIGIGETGLDFFYENSPKELQARLFRVHIDAARKSKLPLIVHTRAADEETIQILETEMEKGEFTGLIHCFSTTRELAEKAIKLGLYISLSGIITFKKSENLRDIVKNLPIERLLVETDAPYLAPEPHRGKCNEPSYVVKTLNFIADLLSISKEEFAKITTTNFYNLFKKI